MSATNFRVLPEVITAVDRTLLRNVNKALMVVLLVAPGMILFLTFVLVPVVQSARYSLFDWNGFGPPPITSGSTTTNVSTNTPSSVRR